LPPGREKLRTRPAATGLPLDANTIGIVLVARLVASEPGVPVVTMTSGLRRTNSAAKPGRRLSRPSAQRNSTTKVSPSTYPSSRSFCRKAPTTCDSWDGDEGPRNPMREVLPVCARARTGHVAAAPSRLMNSRRLMSAPRLRTKASYQVAPEGWKGGGREVR
jgi:hypothetical protein